MIHKNINILKRFFKYKIKDLNDIDISDFSNTIFDFKHYFSNNIYFTPMIQKIIPNEEYLEYLDDLRLEKINQKNSLELIESLINESLKNCKNISISKNVFIKHKDFNGFIDFLIFKDNIPVLSIISMKHVLDTEKNYIKYEENLFIQPVIIDYFLYNYSFNSFTCLYTNGHFWKYDKGYSNTYYQKTKWYKPLSFGIIKNKLENPFLKLNEKESIESKKIWYDFDHLEIILGLIKYSADMRSKEELELEDLYDNLDDLKYLEKK